ncbi:very-long-chain 3-oxoacyl-CoA reductase [Atheta coriaria]|uniref:very-long-chain 3-oxoacyl-CoA reductase n=1 Tax=Dalotia coriaria TaxID=877792 RepID=UPI0031F3A2D8
MAFMDSVSVICVALVGFQLLRFLYRLFYNTFAPVLGINSVNFKQTGKWAVITGATDGVGKAYAEALAKKGMDIVLISRTQTKLDDVAKDIVEKYKVNIKTIAVDFTEGESIYNLIDKNLQGLEIGVLVNNVGMSYPHPEYFLQQKDENLYKNIINCNVLSVTYMCKIVMPGMVERKRGVIINISSAAAVIPNPLLTVYAATKSYVDNFSYNLRMEYANQGIIIQSILPGYVATNMSKIRRSTWMAPSPKTFVAEALTSVGVQDHTTGYYAHTLMNSVIHSLEYVAPNMCHKFVKGTLENIRKRALKRTN